MVLLCVSWKNVCIEACASKLKGLKVYTRPSSWRSHGQAYTCSVLDWYWDSDAKRIQQLVVALSGTSVPIILYINRPHDRFTK